MAFRKPTRYAPPAPSDYRRIRPDEQTLTATEIVLRFELETGHQLHATNAGNAAKALGLDYTEDFIGDEEEFFAAPAQGYVMRERRYGVDDLPLIFARLEALAKERARWGR